MTKPDQKYTPIPTLLSKSDAMLYAADQLDKMVDNLLLAVIFKDALAGIKTKDAPFESAKEASDTLEGLRVLTSGVVDKDIQVAALRAAAAEIRAVANETKLAEARAHQKGITP